MKPILSNLCYHTHAINIGCICWFFTVIEDPHGTVSTVFFYSIYTSGNAHEDSFWSANMATDSVCLILIFSFMGSVWLGAKIYGLVF